MSTHTVLPTLTRTARVLWATLLLCLACTVSACHEDLGSCDEAAAKEVYYETVFTSGAPFYAGQALVQKSCGGMIGVCHSEQAEGDLRSGAPAGLDFNVGLAKLNADVRDATGMMIDADQVARLRDALKNVHDFEGHIYHSVDEASMPPGEAGEAVLAGSGAFENAAGEALPPVGTKAGKAILKNWLACDAPVVERVTDDRPAGVEPVGDIVPRR